MKCYKKDYPRPQFVRDNWVNLNGMWDFAFDDENAGERNWWFQNFPPQRKIRVPFTYETKLSTIQDEKRHDYIWYSRNFTVDAEKLKGNNVILHFEGSDYITKVWVNGYQAGEHTGGYSRFSFDITTYVKEGENQVVVKVEDTFDTDQPRGKQRWHNHNFGCWYVQTTGIWKTVWLEYVPKTNIKSVKITPLLSEEAVELEVDFDADESLFGKELKLESTISYKDQFVNFCEMAVANKHIVFKLEVNVKDNSNELNGVALWSPNNPNLYDLELTLSYKNKVCDKVESYFGMREIRIEGPNILLNGRPLYQKLILDQGYWDESHLTPPNEEALCDDIDKILKLGYNGVRKHQKIEDERFLYWCDVKGVLVWSEAPAAYRFTDKAVEAFTTEWISIVKQNYNHPCIITWTPFNESWGIFDIEKNITQQHFTEAIYYITKSLDKYRPVIVNDGWEHTVSDIITLHDYEESGDKFFRRYNEMKEEILTTEVYHCYAKSAFANGYSYKGQPIIISEFGGIAFEKDKDGWGYGNKVKDEEEFIKRFESITTAIKKTPYICGYCYTQVSDVQQEKNGLLDKNHNYKINPDLIKAVNDKTEGYWRI